MQTTDSQTTIDTAGQTPEGLPAKICYRLIHWGETIRATDEFLTDDVTTWDVVGKGNEWCVGRKWTSNFQPMRRVIGDNK